MHRLSSLPGAESNEVFTVVEQPPAPILFLTSAATDISTLSACLQQPELGHWNEQLRALPLDCLRHPAQIDHYLATTGCTARVLVVRLLGGRGHWSYGLEQCRRWQSSAQNRTLIVLAGTVDQNDELHPIGSVSSALSQQLALLLREGGMSNMTKVLKAIHPFINRCKAPELLNVGIDLQPERMADPAPFDWCDEPGAKVGVLLYRAHARAADTDWCHQLLTALRSRGLSPRALWVSSLRDPVVQEGVQRAFQAQDVQLVVSTTAFASVQFQEAGLGTPLWDGLDLPVLQLLCSGRSKQDWDATTQGLDPIDLSLQVVLPELDGRITTRIGAFREVQDSESSLSTAVKGLVPDSVGLNWLADHARCWVDLRQTEAAEKRVALVLANYPVRNGRLANGVGLDTPASTINILNWLAEAGVELGSESRPDSSEALMARLLSGRSNDPESFHLQPLTYLPLHHYLRWWSQLPPGARALIERRWGSPEQAVDLEEKGFAVHGLLLGHVAVLIQPSRGYDPDQISDLHSPDLPPPHRYLAQYLWLQEVHATQLMVHVGKHGSAEWLPGKSVGLSEACGPGLALAPIPHVYPFIVNDPGEGSQAKRRGHAVILDHLTPPLGRAGLHGSLLSLEALLDEYVEARQVAAERCDVLEQQIKQLLQHLDWPSFPDASNDSSS
ncbi:cobaltochelatase subunit CobN, partial [Synechococcus sp. MU1655]|uniref:cobaltochelatase subunit CobN n=1 Tax=Synechococcus sp. MU1655 TaxID=2508355 RepID=UPI002026B20E